MQQAGPYANVILRNRGNETEREMRPDPRRSAFSSFEPESPKSANLRKNHRLPKFTPHERQKTKRYASSDHASDAKALNDCEDKDTGIAGFVMKAPPNLPVDTTPMFQNNQCTIVKHPAPFIQK